MWTTPCHVSGYQINLGPPAIQDAIYYAYFAPYSYERHQDLIAKSLSSKHVRLEVLGETLDGHDIDLLQIGKRLLC